MVLTRWGKANKFLQGLNEEERMGMYEVVAVIALLGFSAVVAKVRIQPKEKTIEEKKNYKKNTCRPACNTKERKENKGALRTCLHCSEPREVDQMFCSRHTRTVRSKILTR